ncbi:hypothetical protein [Roseivirga thermotolerans]|uniref:Uncharacterized protein n=1 Tax=Roseivirga thermotolerans TaxID=1758176 RepID=A0ABQ3IC42_9BACT|nr:hypothetical protein [Roseivirga thermotolerans]GHE72813.1 hypothetical protein GCM10011340_31590 [Roseivirga thermotolerans]
MTNELILMLVAAFVGFAANYFLERFRDRMIYLKKKITNQAIASSHQTYWGNIKVLYNELETVHVSLTKVEIINDSNRDIDNFNLLITCDNNSRILASQGTNMDNQMPLHLTEEYLIAKKESNSVNLDKFVQYSVKVLNRKSSIIIDLVLDSSLIQVPFVEVIIEKKGIKLSEYKIFDQSRYGWSIVITGILALLVFDLAIYFSEIERQLAIILSFIAGALNFFIGGLIVEGFKRIKSFLT